MSAISESIPKRNLEMLNNTQIENLCHYCKFLNLIYNSNLFWSFLVQLTLLYVSNFEINCSLKNCIRSSIIDHINNIFKKMYCLIKIIEVKRNLKLACRQVLIKLRCKVLHEREIVNKIFKHYLNLYSLFELQIPLKNSFLQYNTFIITFKYIIIPHVKLFLSFHFHTYLI